MHGQIKSLDTKIIITAIRAKRNVRRQIIPADNIFGNKLAALARCSMMAATANQRRAKRAPLARPGILVAGRGQPQYACIIINITAGGAGVRTLESTAIPDSVFLISLAEKRAYASMVMWRKPQTLGLKFVTVIELGKVASGAHDFLTRIWTQHNR
ncbi:MAG: PilZ domain-containing protein [Alphaproteobacteria bacterium]|nr:PilZ domain-containing protein [Alphaproteobacteria bacterium]MBL7097362.1 PilZ domain-containing protein [Alphaproteobacteria bacterium]